MKASKLKKKIDKFLENPKNTKQECLDMLQQVRTDLDDLEVEVIEKVIEKEVIREVPVDKKTPNIKKDNSSTTNWY